MRTGQGANGSPYGPNILFCRRPGASQRSGELTRTWTAAVASVRQTGSFRVTRVPSGFTGDTAMLEVVSGSVA
jgi:hypothetical protein